MEYAAKKVRELDQWAHGFVVGVVFGGVVVMGIVWAVMEPLK